MQLQGKGMGQRQNESRAAIADTSFGSAADSTFDKGLLSKLAAAALGASLLISNPAQAIVIDGFSSPFPEQAFTTTEGSFVADVLVAGESFDGSFQASNTSLQSGLDDVIGQTRQALLSYGSQDTRSTAEIFADNDVLQLRGGGSGTTNLTLSYSGARGLNANLTRAKDIRLDLLDTENIFSPVPFSLSLTSGAGTADEVTATQVVETSAAGMLSFIMADFTGLDFSDVDAIVLEISLAQATVSELALGSIRTDTQAQQAQAAGAFAVPAPAGLYLSLAMMSGLLVRARSSRQ